MSRTAYYPKFTVRDNNDLPLRGGKLYTYKRGTDTLQTTYQNYACTTPHENPIVLDGIRGEAEIYLQGNYKFVLCNSDDSIIWTQDDIISPYPTTTMPTPEDYGAAGDGVTDDSDAFNEFFSSTPTNPGVLPGECGGTLWLNPTKQYLLKDVTPSQNSSVIGLGPKSQSIIKRHPDAVYGAFYCVADNLTGGDGTTFANIAFESANDGLKAAIYATSWPSLNILDCWFVGGIGITLHGTQDIQIAGNTFDTNDYGIYCYGGAAGTDANEARILNNWFRSTTASIYAANLRASVIGYNVFCAGGLYDTTRSIHFEPLVAGGVKGVKIVGNGFYPYGADYYIQRAIEIGQKCSHVAVIGNTAEDWVSYFVAVDTDTEGILIADNTLRLKDEATEHFGITYPIAVTGGTRATITGNNIDVHLTDETLTLSSMILCAATNSAVNNNTLRFKWDHATEALNHGTGLIVLNGDGTACLGNAITVEDVTATLTVAAGIAAGTNVDSCRIGGNTFNQVNTATITLPVVLATPGGNYLLDETLT